MKVFLRQSIERYCDVPVLGLLPKSKAVEIPDRHLGLIPAGEQDELQNRIALLGKLVTDNVNLDELLAVAHSAAPLPAAEKVVCLQSQQPSVKIGVLQDKAFSFYYPENLEALEEAGAQLVPVNSMEDTQLPDVDAFYIGGGFPEVMAEQISANQSLLEQIKAKIEEDMPVYAECGGLMYLAKHIVTAGGVYPMVGVFDCDVEMKSQTAGDWLYHSAGGAGQSVLPGGYAGAGP